MTKEQTHEAEALANSRSKGSDAEAHSKALEFPETTRQVVQYYQTQANDEEKKVVVKAIKQAARAIRQDIRASKGEEQRRGRSLALPDPEEIAAALYNILARDRAATVRGDPRDGDYTAIEGRFDLNDVARKLLSPGRWTRGRNAGVTANPIDSE